MVGSTKIFNKFIASLLCVCMFAMNAPIALFADEFISGVDSAGNTYNIEAEKVSGETGFRHYDKFSLQNDYVANLIYKDNYSKFVNLVDSQITINGIVNTMKGGNFYNGHAIFVSPNGMVVGASGVLNVGSLSVLTPSQDTFKDFKDAFNSNDLSSYKVDGDSYKGLITDSHGGVVINGKILARDEVNIYGGGTYKEGDTIADKINIDGGGIIAGWKDSKTSFNNLDAAKNTFNNLVSNNITDTTKFALEDGKIKIVASSYDELASEEHGAIAKLIIKDANIAAGSVELSAETKMEDVYFDPGSAIVEISNSNIIGNDVSITATAESKSKQNINFIPPVVWAMIFENTTYDDEGNIISEQGFTDYFSREKPYSGFAGNRAIADISIKSSKINAVKNDVNIKSKAVADLTVESFSLFSGNPLSAEAYPQLLYAYGTKTQSKVNIDDSTIIAKNDVYLDAFSSNNLDFSYLNDNAVVKLSATDAYNVAVFNTSTIADTIIDITNGSAVTAGNDVNATALAYANLKEHAENTATVGKNDFSTATEGGSGAALLFQINNSSVNSKVNIKDSSVTSSNDTNINAQNANIQKKTLSISTSPKGYEKQEPPQEAENYNGDGGLWDTIKGKLKAGAGWLKDKGMSLYSKYDDLRQQTYKSIYKKVTGKAQDGAEDAVNDAAGEGQTFDKATFQAGGGVLLEKNNYDSNVIIDNSALNAGNAMNVSALTVDKLANKVTSKAAAKHGENESAVIGAGISVIVTQRNNYANVLVKNGSSLTAKELNVDAVNELPGNHGTLGIANSLLTLGLEFNGDAQDNWDIDWHSVKEPEGAAILPSYGLFGLFNNYVAASSSGDKFAISASVAYDGLKNDAKVLIENSTLNSEKDIVINAVNSVVARDSAGFFSTDSVLNIKGILDIYDAEGGIGTGGVVVIQNIENNATSEIVKSVVDSTLGNVDVNSASEQSYMNILTNGAQASTLAINGAVNVQKISGNTIAQIEQQSNVTAKKDVNVNAGKATVVLASQGSTTKENDQNQTVEEDIIGDKPIIADAEYVKKHTDTRIDTLLLKNRREAKDHVTNIGVVGTLTRQKSDGETSKLTASIGASVNAVKIDRTVKAAIENSAVSAASSINVKSITDVKAISFALSGALAGGGSTGGQGNAQGLQGIGGAQNIINEGGAVELDDLGDADGAGNEQAEGAIGDAGRVAGQSYSIAAAGAVNSLVDSTKTESTVSNSTLELGKDLKVTANQESFVLNGAGALGASGKVGVGAGINLYKQNGHIKAFIKDNSIVNFKYNNDSTATVLAKNDSDVYSIGVGIATATNSNDGVNAAIGGSFVYNTIKPTIIAEIENAAIDGLYEKAPGAPQNAASKTNISVEALSDNKIFDIAGGAIATNSGDSFSVGAGIAAVVNSFTNQIDAKINNATLTNVNKVDVKANNKQDTLSAGAALAVNGKNTTTSVNFQGSVGVDYFNNKVHSQILDSQITANDEVSVNSSSDIENKVYLGILQVALSGNGFGANGSVAVNVHDNDVFAKIEGNKDINAKDILVGAKSKEFSDVVPVTIAIATDSQVMFAADVCVNIIKNKVNAYILGDNSNGSGFAATRNVLVAADDETTLYVRGWTLAAASADAPFVVGGAVNVDRITKTVNAQIGQDNKKTKIASGGTTSVAALSTNSIGGTKNSSQGYDRDDITSDAYQDNLMKKDSDGNYSGLNYSNDFKNWNMFYNLAAGSNAAISGAVIVKTIDNHISSQIINSEIASNDLNLLAKDYSVKNIVAGQISASSVATIGAQVLVTNDKSDTKAIVSNGSKLTVTNTLSMAAVNQKDNNQIVVAASGSKNASIGVNVLHNTINDLAVARVEDSELSSKNLKIDAQEDINASKIIVSAGGAGQGVALNVSPVINYYGDDKEESANTKGKTIAEISNSTVKKAKIEMLADTNIKTRDIAVGAAGAGQGFAASGLAIKNTYNTKTRALIDKESIIDTEQSVDINANSVANSNNWIVGASGIGQGASAIVNVIINNMVSEVAAKIDGSEIKKAGNISLNANKDKKDKLSNHGISASGAGMGASAVANVMYNIYDNKVAAEILNTAINNSSSIAANAFSNRDILNYNVGVAGAGLGAGAIANAIVNNIRTDTLATVNSKEKDVKTAGKLSVHADDYTFTDNTIGLGAGGFGAAGANINLFYSDNLAKAEVASTTGTIEADSAEIKSTTTSGMDGVTVGVVAGIFGIAGDVQVIRLGKALAYDDNDTASGIDKANENTKNAYDTIMGSDAKYYNPTDTSKAETGSVARVNGKLETVNNVDVKAENKLNGKKDGDALELTNVAVGASGGNANVGIKNVKIANNTIAEISGGMVESASGKVLVDAKNAVNVKISTVKVDVAGLEVSGGSEVYNNTSNTVAQIKNSTVKGNGVDVVSKSTSHGKIEATHAVVAAADAVGVDLSETTDKNNASALISGNTNIDAKAGKLTVHATSDTDLSSTKNTVKVSAVTLANVAKNTVNASSVTQALIKNVTGEINAKGIDIVSDYNKMSAYASSNITSVSAVSAATWEKGGAVMNATFSSGIDSPAGLEIVNDGQTLIETAKSLGSEKISAKSVINKTSVELGDFYAGTFAEAENTAKSNTFLKAKDHSAKSLLIDAMLDSVADAYLDDEMYSLLDVNSLETYAKNTSKLNLEVAGKNSIENTAVINAINKADAKSNLAAIGVGVAVSGLRVRVNSEVTADTLANIGGDFSFDSADISVNTTRNSVMSKGSKSGGLISVADAEAANILKGKSELNIKGFDNDLSKNNKLSITNEANNTFEITSTGSSGGFIDISDGDKVTSTLNSSVVTNVIDSEINSNKKVSIETKNNTVVKDSATSGGGGFISVAGAVSTKEYTANAKMTLKNSTINARDIKTNVLSDISSAKKDDYIIYKVANGGVIATDTLKIENTLNQTAEIELENSKMLASNDVELNAKTSSLYKQHAEACANGLVSVPKAKAYLTSNNTQNISLDSGSMISATNDARFNLDSSNTLDGHVESKAKNFAGKPTGESYVEAVINNTIDSSGTIKAGKLVDINFMGSSHNNLTVDVDVQNDAAVASTSKDGRVTRTINSTLNVKSDAKIVSDKDVGIHYSNTYGSVNSRLHSKSTSYLLFGIPIVHEETLSNITRNATNVFNLNGKVIAGTNSEKYMKINNDGSVDMSVTTGFTHDDYNLKLYGEDWEQIKQEKIDTIDNTITRLDESIESYKTMEEPLKKSINEYISQINDCNSKINTCNSNISKFENAIGEINKQIENNSGYMVLNTQPGDAGFSDFDNAVFADLKQNSCGASENQVSEAAYDAMFAGFKKYYKDYLKNNPTSQKPLLDSLSAYLSGYSATEDANKLTDVQKTALADVASNVEKNLSVSELGVFTYKKFNSDGAVVTLVGLNNPVTNAATGKIESCDNLDNRRNSLASLNNHLTELTNRQNELKQQFDEIESKILGLENQVNSLNEEKLSVNNLPDPNADANLYSIEFKDTNYPQSKIDITGIYNTQIKGNGTFEMGRNLFKVDNYSTRSLIFNNIDTTAVSEVGLFIHGTDYKDYKDSPSAINDNVHFVTTSSTGESGIIVNNYYDNTNPVAHNQNPDAEGLSVPEPTSFSDIVFNGAVKTAEGLKVFNDSGSIYFEKIDTSLIQNAIDLVATKGDVNLKADGNTKLVLSAVDNIFAGNSVNIVAAEYDINAKITAGYKNNLNLKITDDMLNNLSFDPTTGENEVLIDIGQTPWLNETNNIKALYRKDRYNQLQISLFDINDPSMSGVDDSKRGKINIGPGSSSSKINWDNVKGYEGRQDVTIENYTDKDLNINSVYATGDIIIYSKGDINQFGSVMSYDANALIESEGNTLSLAPVFSAGDVLLLNTSNDTGTILTSFYGTTKGNIYVQNSRGAVYMHPDACLMNLSPSDGSEKYGIFINNYDDTAGIFLYGTIYNEGGDDIYIANNGKLGLELSGKIENTTGDIRIRNSNSNITLGNYLYDENQYIKTDKGNIVIEQIGGDILNQTDDPKFRIKIESGENLTLDVTNGSIGVVGDAVNIKVLGSVDKISADNAYVNLTGSGIIDQLRANNANINCSEIRLAINDGIINNYAELRNRSKLGVVNNDNTKLVDKADIQLYTAKTGSFSLILDDTINMKTNAPVVYNNPDMLANGYHSEGNFVNKGQKESKVLYESVKSLETPDLKSSDVQQKHGALWLDEATDKALTGEYTVYELSTAGATVKNDKNLQKGDITTIKFDISDITVNAKVVDVEDGKAILEFIDMTEEDEEKIHKMFNSLIQLNQN